MFRSVSEHSLTLLGSLSATATSTDGSRHLGRGKPVALLAYLSAAPGRRASRERLATLLWSEGTSEQARQNLRQTLWYVRRRLGDWLVTNEDFVELAAAVQTDRERFLQSVADQHLDDAIALYGGEFIPDFAAPGAAAFEEWAELERRRLRALFVGCCDTVARQALAGGHFARAIELARRARDAAPQELATWRLLLEALMAGRDTVGCLAEAEHLEALSAAGDVELDDATRATLRSARALATGTRAPDPGLAGGERPSKEHDVAALAPELIGREAEFRHLLARWEQARERQGGAVLVTAVAGLGKTRLLTDFQARLRASRARVAVVRANPGDRGVPSGFLAALAETVAQRQGAAAISPESANVLVQLAPALASTFPAARADAAAGDDALRRRVGALLDLLRAVSDDVPFALLVDDLHWVDADSRRALEAIAGRLEGTSILLVLAARPPVEALGGFAGLERIELSRLDLPRVTEFVTRLGELPGEAWAMELPAQVLAATRGVPLTIIEALHRLLESEALVLRDGRWESAAPSRAAALLAEGMVLEARLRTLTPGAREILLVLAVLGRPTPTLQLLEGVSQMTSPDDPRLLELEHRGFIGHHDGTVFVVHDEIAEAVIAGATEGDRKAAQACAALTLLQDRQRAASLRLAAEHAWRAHDAGILREVVQAWTDLHRRQGDTRSIAAIVDAVLAPDVAPAQRKALIRLTPWWKRPAGSVRRAALAGIAAIVALAAWSVSRDEALPEYSVYVRTDGPEPRLLRVDIPALAAWDPDAPLEAEEVPPRDLPGSFGTGERFGIVAIPGRADWVGTTFFNDSGGQEFIVIDGQGDVHRPASAPGDDAFNSLSPDGRFAAIASARWNADVDRYNIGLVDLRDSSMRRLQASRAYDSGASWSPDGTRLAFLRNRFESRDPLQLCVSSFDGQDVDCSFAISQRIPLEIGWVDDAHLSLGGGDEPLQLLDVRTGLVSKLAAAGVVTLAAVAPRLRLLQVQSDHDGSTGIYIGRIEGGLSLRPVVHRGAVVQGVLRAVVARRGPRYLDTLRVLAPPAGVPVDQAFRLRVEGRDASGAPLPVRALRLYSLDSTVAVVVDGILRPRRLGRVRIVATAGGWRSDTVDVAIVPSTAQPVLGEHWDASWEERWRPFGSPQAVVRGRELLPNGDGRYASGVYLRRDVVAAQGVGLEVRVSLPMTTLYQWQSLNLQFVLGGDSLRLAAWDHRTGDPPGGGRAVCATGVGGDGAVSRERIGVNDLQGGFAAGPTPPGILGGTWFTLRLQLFPDGRCGVAVNGVPLAVTEAVQPIPPTIRPTVIGHSAETTLRVGALELWSGVRGDVPWSARP